MSNLLVLAKVSCLPSHLLFCQLGNRTHPASFGISVSLTLVQGCTYDLGHIFSAFLKVQLAKIPKLRKIGPESMDNPVISKPKVSG